ncbi:MAG TPA: PilX N-terminal domain-containing pilus assembly protein [Candidatus Saccharimonadales bacterium]|nr:PilX N-terminal domain-containing pilus assembly protein [Candidatus Saccharimonadales bacterium]
MVTNTRLSNNQQGMAAIIVTMVLTIVITLIVLGFAQVTRHNQREALDRQLSTQAYYAAETGINDAYAAILAGNITNANTQCNNLTTGGGPLTGKDTLSPDGSVKYTCVLVDPTPTSIGLSNLSAGSATTEPLIPVGGTAVNSITVTWTKDPGITFNSASYCTSGIGNFLSKTSWDANCAYALVQLDVVPADTISQASLISSQQTFYFQPSNTSTSGLVSAVSAHPATITLANCSAVSCSASINSGLGAGKYYVRIHSLYEGISDLAMCVNVAVGATSSPNCNSATTKLSGAQAMIDVTGRDQDQLRRVQVRVPLTGVNQSNIPSNALESTGSICKLLTVGPNGVPYTTGNCP